MVMAFVAAHSGARAIAGQLDPFAFYLVDLADRRAFGVDHLHMLANILKAVHSALSSVIVSVIA
jgi:hypothetical protein